MALKGAGHVRCYPEPLETDQAYPVRSTLQHIRDLKVLVLFY